MNRFEIRVVGHLDARRARALGATDWRLLPDGESSLVFFAVDLAATYGIVARLRDAGLGLVFLERAAGEQTPSSGDGAGEGREGSR